MASIILENVTLSYPILGGAKPKIGRNAEMNGAGALIRDNSNQSRSIIALNGVSLELSDGDRLGLIGRNGSGKSTLLRMIAGIYEPMQGIAKIQGSVAGLFSAGLGIHAETSGYRNIVLYGLMAGYTRSEVEEIMPSIVEFCGLGDYLDMPVRTYSNGMAMRLTFACATAFNADIILMDEWLGAGDPSFQEAAQKRLKRMVDDAGILVLASHNHSTIQRSCNKLAWLDRGRLRAIGDVDDVLAFHDEEMRKELGGASAKKCIESKSKEEGSFVEAVPPQNDRALLEERIEARRSARRAQRKKNPYKNPGATTSNADVCN